MQSPPVRPASVNETCRDGAGRSLGNNGQYRAAQAGDLHHCRDGAVREADLWHWIAFDGPGYAELGRPFSHSRRAGRQAGSVAGSAS
jgi:hypothetical protein